MKNGPSFLKLETKSSFCVATNVPSDSRIHPMLTVWPERLSTSEAFMEKGSSEIRLNTQDRSEEHTSELQSLTNLVCRLLLEKKQNLSPKLTAEPFTKA